MSFRVCSVVVAALVLAGPMPSAWAAPSGPPDRPAGYSTASPAEDAGAPGANDELFALPLLLGRLYLAAGRLIRDTGDGWTSVRVGAELAYAPSSSRVSPTIMGGLAVGTDTSPHAAVDGFAGAGIALPLGPVPLVVLAIAGVDRTGLAPEVGPAGFRGHLGAMALARIIADPVHIDLAGMWTTRARRAQASVSMRVGLGLGVEWIDNGESDAIFGYVAITPPTAIQPWN